MSLIDSLLLDPALFEVWIAICSDGGGSGTLNDPYDGSTAAKFDAIMNSLPEGTQVHLGPGEFQTAGYSDDATGGWQIRAGMRIVGSGIDITTLINRSCRQTPRIRTSRRSSGRSPCWRTA